MIDKARQKIHRVNTKVNEEDYQLLLLACSTYKFKSIYELLNTLLICFLRNLYKERDMKEEFGIAEEINEMFAELETPKSREKMFSSYSMLTKKYRKNY